MKTLFTYLSKNVLSLVVGPRIDREWTGIRPMRFIALLAMILCFSVGQMWGVVTVKLSDVAGSWANESSHTSWSSGGFTFTASGGGNNGKYFTSDGSWRIYNGGTASITPPSGYKIIAVISESNQTWSINGTTGVASYSRSSSGSTNFTTFTITYKASAGSDCNTLDVTGGSTVILPAGSTTYSARDWRYSGAPIAYAAEATNAIGSGDYCVKFTQAMDNANASGLQLKASEGVVKIENITSTYGVDITILCSSSSGNFTVSLDGAAADVTGANTTLSISTKSTSADLTISKTTANTGYIEYIQITPKAEPTCDKAITIGTPDITGSGTVTFASGGSSKSAGDEVETCDGGAEITATVTPASGYYCSALSFSGGSVSVDPEPGAGNYPAYSSSQDYTLSFDEDANATLSTSATFTAKTATAWSWTYNSGAIPNPLEMYVNEYHQLDVTYTPADLLSTQKNYTVTKESSIAEVSKQVGYYKMRGATGVTEVTNTTVTLTLGDLSQTVNVKVKPLPTIHCVDLIHGESFSDVAATVATGVVTLTKTMPTHDDLAEPGSGNDCEKEHLHLIGWIRSDYSKVDAYMNGTGNKPTISEITSAGTGYYYTAGSSITLTDAMHGKTFYAVWAKEE